MFKCFKFQPLSLVRSYLGEKLAFYFALCGFYNKMLILPSIIGLIVFIYGAATVAGDEPTYVDQSRSICTLSIQRLSLDRLYAVTMG